MSETIKNGPVTKILATLLALLMVAAITGGFTLAREVSAMAAKIETLTLTVQDVHARLLYLERAMTHDPAHSLGK